MSSLLLCGYPQAAHSPHIYVYYSVIISVCCCRDCVLDSDCAHWEWLICNECVSCFCVLTYNGSPTQKHGVRTPRRLLIMVILYSLENYANTLILSEDRSAFFLAHPNKAKCVGDITPPSQHAQLCASRFSLLHYELQFLSSSADLVIMQLSRIEDNQDYLKT